jgi:hypothetical protein
LTPVLAARADLGDAVVCGLTPLLAARADLEDAVLVLRGRRCLWGPQLLHCGGACPGGLAEELLKCRGRAAQVPKSSCWWVGAGEVRLLGLGFGDDAIWLMQSSVYNIFREINSCFQVASLRRVLGLMLCEFCFCFQCRSRFVGCFCAPSLFVSMLGVFWFDVVRLWAAVFGAGLLCLLLRCCVRRFSSRRCVWGLRGAAACWVLRLRPSPLLVYYYKLHGQFSHNCGHLQLHIR